MKPTILSPMFFLLFLLMLPAWAVSQEEEPDDSTADSEAESDEDSPVEEGDEPVENDEEPAEAPVEEATEETGTAEEPADEGGEMEPWLPPAQEPPEDYDSGATFDDDMEPVDNLPFAKGDMELGFGLGGWGGNGYFSLSVGASFAYYVIPRLAPGISLTYQTIFGELKYPQSFTTLPYLKFVLIRSRSFAPYLIAAVGREFQWAGVKKPDDDPTQDSTEDEENQSSTDSSEEGYIAVDSWIVGGGVGAHIGMSASFSMRIQLLFLYYFLDESVYITGKDGLQDGFFSFQPSLGMSVTF